MKIRLGMIVPSLNTIAEDDLRRYCPADVSYHIHRIRLRKEGGRVTPEALLRAYLEAAEEATLLLDLNPSAIAFNCTGASVANGPLGDEQLAVRMTEALSVPATNTMVAIKQALSTLGSRRLLHVCPFSDVFSRLEREALEAAGHEVVRTVSLDFTDARKAALMAPEAIADFVRGQMTDDLSGILLSCANVRAFEAAQALEAELGLPVVTSNQATLWALLRDAGWRGQILGGGNLLQSLA